MLKNLLLIASVLTTLPAQSAGDFITKQTQDFKKEKTKFDLYKKTQEDEFKSYQEAQTKTYNEYIKEISEYWDDPKMSTKKSWVSYTKDKKTRTNVDFEKKTIVLETIASSKKEAKERLQNALENVVTIDTKRVQENDPLEQKLAKIKKPKSIITGEVEAEPILSTLIFDKEPTKSGLISYVNRETKDSKIKSHKSNKIKNKRVYRLNISMPKDATMKRSKIYYQEVKKQAKRQNLPISLIFAIMHSESSFNPRARSHVPAYGLMQIVPRTAGIDSYQYLYNKRRVVSGSYLYNSKNNITMGSAYLHLLYYKYLKDIKDPDSRLYCTIAAYNTGAGNVAWAFTKTNSMRQAAPIINSMTSTEVYNRLMKDLKYDEPKHYLNKVSKRVGSYYKLYG